MATMTQKQIAQFWQRAFMPKCYRALTADEQAFIVAAVYGARQASARSFASYQIKAADTAPDVERMDALVQQNPGLLESIGPALACLITTLPGCAASLQYLLDHDVPLQIDESSYNVLFEAEADTLRVVLEAGAADATCVAAGDPSSGWPGNTTLMYWAAMSGDVERAQLLIEHGIGALHEWPIKGNGERGTTSLQEALSPPWHTVHYAGDPDWVGRKRRIAQLLIEDGAYYDIYSACALDDTERLQALLREDPEWVFAEDSYKVTPLHWAARSGSMACAEILLLRDAEVNALNKGQRTPLQGAAEQDRVAMIRLLAENGAELNTQDRKGRTPLHRAAYQGMAAAAETLLEVGADPMVLTKTGKNAFEIARKDAKYLKKRA